MIGQSGGVGSNNGTGTVWINPPDNPPQIGIGS